MFKCAQLKIVYFLCSIQHIKDNFGQHGLITNNCSLYTRSDGHNLNNVRPELSKLSQSTVIDQNEIFAEEHFILLSNRSP